MAFMNERLTSLQKEDFLKKGIKHPHHPNDVLNPNFWTIDHEQNACLINIGAYHDLPEEEQFIFIYNSEIFLFTLQMCSINDTTKAWELKKYISLTDSDKINEEQLIMIFKEALSKYKYNGLPDGYKQQFEMKINF
ncbi:MAG: hypothetical protein J1F11_05735 [Oscillospiraceae bacterium]|nr:hypothetical protein [Oscillospiraceae bacterium]